MKINKRKITIWSIMSLSLVIVLTFVLVCNFRKIDTPSTSNENDYKNVNYVEINDGADYLSYVDVTIDGTSGLKVVGFASNFTTSVYKDPTDMYSLTIPEIHNGKKVIAIDIPRINAGTVGDPYEVPWLSGAGVEEQIGKVVVPKTVLKISEGAFNAFEELRQMELPFVGTERGNTKGTAFNKNTSGNCSFYSIFGTDKYDSMNDYNLQAITTADGINTLEDLKAKRATGAAISYGTGQINWYFNSSTDSSSVLYFNVPINLEEVFITDEYCVADHAFFRSPALKKISIQWANNIPSDQKLASGLGQRVFDTSTALEFVVLPASLSSYGAGLFSHCLSLHTVAVGGVETGETSYTELNSTYPKKSTGEFIKQVHLPLENPAGLVEGSDVKIEESTFEFCISIENMVIPHNVTSIKAHAFDGCTNMINVRSSSSAYALGNYCDLPDNLELIERLAFRNCTALQNITVPRNVNKIEEAAFNRCSALQTITLPFVGRERGNDGSSVSSLFGYIFGQYGNSDAGDTSATPDMCVFQATDGNPSKNRNEGDMTARGEFYIPQSLKNVVITDETVLVSGAFMNCSSLVSLQITSFEEDEDGYSIMTIGEGALGGCINLESLSIPFVGPNEYMPAKATLNNTIRNGKGASTYQLGYIFGQYEYRDTTRIVQGEAFTSSNPAIYYFPSKLSSVQLTHQTYLPSHSFWKTAMIKNVIIDDKTIGAQREVFHGCSNLESLTVPFAGMGRGLYYRSSDYGGLFSGPNSSYYGDYWYSDDYYLRNSIIWLFSNSPSDAHYLNAGVTDWTGYYIGYIPNSLKYLTVTDETYFQTNAINGFTSLERVTIKKGDSVDIAQMHIDEGILANCGNLTTLDLPFIGRDYNPKHEHSKAYTIGWLFGNKYTYNNCYSVYQGVGNGATYQIPNKLTTISFDNYITTIANGAFRGMKSLESVKSNSVISQLGNYAFENCSSLVEVVLPRATYSIMGDYAFSNCVSLTDIDAFSPSTVRKIGHGALRGTSIKEVDFTRYYYVGDYAFSNCLQLTSVDLTDGGLHSGNTTGYLDYIGKYLFSGCTRLTDVKLADQTVDRQFVSDYMFEGCTSLEDIDLRGKVTSIPNGFLKDCSNLKSYYQVPDGIGAGTFIDKGLVIDPTDPNIKRIGAEAFKGCRSLTSFILPESLKTIGNAAFQNCTGLDVMRIPRSVNEINSIPLGTELNGVDNYTTGVYYGCDENTFHLEVFLPEDEWPWGNNWNCYFPVNIIGDQNENLFTYEYCTELKGYLINGLNMLTSDNPKGVNFAPNNRLLLKGVLKFPAKYNGLTVYGLTKDCFKDYYVNAYEGVNLVTRHPFAEITDFVLGENFVTIGENAFNFDPAGKTTYRDIFSQKTAVQAAKLTSRLCDCSRNDSNIKHVDIAGLNYGNEKYYASNSIVYYQEAWTWTQVGRDSTPVYTMDALKFSFDSNHFQYALGKEIKPKIISIDVNDSYVKYPNGNKNPIRYADNDELYNYIYPSGTLNTNFLNFQYSNNINVGTGKLKLTSNNSKIKGEKTLTFQITKIRIDVMNASLPDADYYGFNLDGTPLDAQTHLFNIVINGTDDYLPQGSKTVEVAVKEYDGSPWQLRQWVPGQNVFGLPDGFTFSGILRTRYADAGYYWEDAGVTQSQYIGAPDGLKNIHIPDPSLWENIEHISDFVWSTNPVIRNTRGEDVSRNFEVLVTGAVCINPFEVDADNLKWPGVFNGTYYEYEYTGREIVPVPTVTNKDGVVLNPQFRVRITSAFSDPDVAIDPSDTLYSAKIMSCDTRNFVFVTYNHSPNKNFNYIDFKVVKAKLRIDMSVPNYLIGVNELEFSFDFANWEAYQKQYNIHVSGLGFNSVLGGTIHTTSATEWAGWKNVIYSSNGPEYFIEWSGTSPFKVTNPTHVPEDITDFYEVTLNATVKIEWNRFDFNYTITDPTLPAPYVIKGVDRGMGIEMYEATADTVNIRYGVDGYEHIFDVKCNNPGVSTIAGVERFSKTFTYENESGDIGSYSNYTIQEVGVIKALTMNMSRDRFYPVSQTIYITTVKGSYVVSDLTKEYDRLAVDPYANLVRKPIDFDASKLIFEFYNKTDKNYTSPLASAPAAIGSYKYTMTTLTGHSSWFNDELEWPKNEVNRNQADFDITRRTIYIYVVDDDAPFDSKPYDGEPWVFAPTGSGNVTGVLENLLDGDVLTGRFMSRDKEIGVYDGDNYADFIINTAVPWRVGNSTLGDQSSNYRIAFKGKYEIKPRTLDWELEGVTTVYDGSYYKPKVTVNEPTYGYTIYYSENPSITLDSDEWTTFPPYKTEPGKYTIYVKVVAPYYQSEMNYCIIEIQGKDIVWNVTNETIPYDGFEHGIEVEVLEPRNHTIYYATLTDETMDISNLDPETLSYSTTCPMFTKDGVHHYWVYVEAPNYQPTSIEHVTLTIDNSLGERQNIGITGYDDYYDEKYHGPIFDFTSSLLNPENVVISYHIGDKSEPNPTWYTTTLEELSTRVYHLPILKDASDTPYELTVRTMAAGYAYQEVEVEVKIKKLDLAIGAVNYSNVFDNKYHTLMLQCLNAGHILEITSQDLEAKVPLLTYRYYFGSDKETAQYVDLDVRYSSVPPIGGNTSGFVSTPLRYKNYSQSPYLIYLTVTAPNCKTVDLYGFVEIKFNENPTWSVKSSPVEIEYLARPVTLEDMKFSTVHDGQPSLVFFSKANPSLKITAPIDLGEYVVQGVYPATSNCAKMEFEIEFSIVPRRLKIDYEKEHEYTGIEWVPDVLAETKTTDTVLIHPYLVDGYNGIDLGDHYIDIELEVPNENYYIDPEDQRLKYTITKRKITITFPDEGGIKIHQYSIPPTKWEGNEDDIQVENLLPADYVEMTMETTGSAARRYTSSGKFTYDGGDYISNWTGTNMNSNAVRVLTLDVYNPDGIATYYDVEIYLIVKIALPQLDVTVSDPTEYNYDNDLHTLDIQMNTNIVNYTRTFWTLSEEEYNEMEDFDALEDRPGAMTTFLQSQAGTYYVAYELNASGYEPYRGKARLVINKVVLVIDIDPFEQIYDAAEHKVNFTIRNLVSIPTNPSARQYYFDKKLMDDRRITMADIDKFFDDGCPKTSKAIYQLWNEQTRNNMISAGEYYAVILYEETDNWIRSKATKLVEIQKRPLYFNFLDTPGYYDEKVYDGDKLVVKSMALYEYDTSNSSNNNLPNSGLVKNHQIVSTWLNGYSFRTVSADCRGDNYDDITWKPGTEEIRALWESPYQYKGDFEFDFFEVFFGASPERIDLQVNYAYNYYPVINMKGDEYQTQLVIKRAEMTRFEVQDSEHIYDGNDAMPAIRTHENGIGEYVYYYYKTDEEKNIINTTPITSAKDVIPGYYKIYISVKGGRNYFKWKGEYDEDPLNGVAALGANYQGYNYKTAYVKVVPAEVQVQWSHLEGLFDVDDDGNVKNHHPEATFTTVGGSRILMDYTIADGNGNPVLELKRAGNYGLSATLPAFSDINPNNYTLLNTDVTFSILKREYRIAEVINDTWLHTNWTKTYTQDFFDRLDTEQLAWLPNFDLTLVVRANANTAGQLYSTSQFTATSKVVFVDPVSGAETDYTDCFLFDLDLLVNLASNDLEVIADDVDVVFDETYHRPNIQVLSYINGYVISYYVMLVKEDGSFFNDWDVESDPSQITYSESMPTKINYGGKSYNAFYDVARYRVYYRVTVGGVESEVGNDDIVYGSVDINIKQANPSLNFGNSGLDRVYNGVAPSLADLQKNISGRYNGRADQLTFAYYEEGGSSEPLTQSPVDVGRYRIVVTSKADDNESLIKNYTKLEVEYAYEITPRPITLTVNTDWEVDSIILANPNLWNSFDYDHVETLANQGSSSNAKYKINTGANTGLCVSDVFKFKISSANSITERGRYFYKENALRDSAFAFETFGPDGMFNIEWEIYYDDQGTGLVTQDKTRNYRLNLDFNLVVHYPYIDVDVQPVVTYSYDGLPKDLLGHGKNIEILNPSPADCIVLYGTRNNDVTLTSYQQTEPGRYLVYFTIACMTGDYEVYEGSTTLVIEYNKRDNNLVINSSLTKIYDAVPYNANTRVDVSWENDPGEALPDPSTWKIEYYEAYRTLNGNNYEYVKTGDAMSSVVDAGDYIYRLVIPAGTLYDETVIERPFTISRRVYVITAPNPDTPIYKTYDSNVWSYSLADTTTIPFTFEGKPGVAQSGLVPGHRLISGKLITSLAKAGTYTGSQVQENRVMLEVNETNDYIIVDGAGNHIKEDNYAVEYNLTVIIEKGDMTVTTNLPDAVGGGNPIVFYPGDGNYFTFLADVRIPNGYSHRIEYSMDGLNFQKEPYNFNMIGDNQGVWVRVQGVPNYNDFQRYFTFDIRPQQNTLIIYDLTKFFDGKPVANPMIRTKDYQGIANPMTIPGLMVEWYNESGSPLPSAPTNVGRYYVQVTYPSKDTYDGISNYILFEIKQLEIAVSWTGLSLTYNASVQEPMLNVIATQDSTMSVSSLLLEGRDYTLTYTYSDYSSITGPVVGKPFNQGAYRVEFNFIPTSPAATNYKLKGEATSVSEYFVINRRAIKISYSGNFDTVSDPFVVLEQANGLTITNLPANVEFKSALRSNGSTTGSYAVKGKYPIGPIFNEKYSWTNQSLGSIVPEPLIQFRTGAPVTGDDTLTNYDIDIDILMNITEGTLPYTVSPTVVDYDGLPHYVDFRLNFTPAGEWSIQYSLNPNDNSSWVTNPSTLGIINASPMPYHVYVKVNTEEYGEVILGKSDAPDYNQFTVTINRLQSEISLPNDIILDKVYDDVAVSNPPVIYNTVNGENRDNDILYKYYRRVGDAWVETSRESVRYAGDYKLEISMKDTPNYAGTTGDFGDPYGPISVEFRIKPRPIQLNVGRQDKIYDGNSWIGKVTNIPGETDSIGTITGIPGDPDSGLLPNHYFSGRLITVSPIVDVYSARAVGADFVLNNEYTVIAKELGLPDSVVKENYEIVLNCDVHINQAEFDAEALGYQGIYDGAAHYASVVFNKPPHENCNYTIEYCYGGTANDGPYSTENYGSTKSCWVYIKITGDNYKTTILQTRVDLTPQNSSINIEDWYGHADGQDKVYDGIEYDISSIVVKLADGDTRTPTFKFFDKKTGEELAGPPINVGEYEFYAHVDEADDGSFAAADSPRVGFRIVPKPVEVVWKPDKTIIEGGKTIYLLTFTGKNNTPIPSAIAKIKDPVEDYDIELSVEIKMPVNANPISIGDYLCVAKIVKEIDQKNYTLTNDEVYFRIQKQQGGIIIPDGDIPQPDDDNYRISFGDIIMDPYKPGGIGAYDYKSLMESGKYYVEAYLFSTRNGTPIYANLYLTVDLITGEVIGIHDMFTGNPIGMVSDGLAADTEVNFTFLLPYKIDEEGNPILDENGYGTPIITTPNTPVSAILDDKVNMAWTSSGITDDRDLKLRVDPTVLSTDPVDPDGVPEIIVYEDYQNVHYYTGSEIKFPITVAITQGTLTHDDDIILEEGIDYEIIWINNVNVSENGKMASFVVVSKDGAGYSFTIGDATTDDYSDDAGTFTILRDKPSRLTLVNDSLYKFEYIDQDFDNATIESIIYSNEERTELYETMSVDDVAKLPLRLGHTYQGQTIGHLLRQFLNDNEDIVIYSKDPTNNIPIYDRKDPNCDWEAVEQDPTVIITTGMRVVLYESGKPHENEFQRDYIEVLLKGDGNGDGYINNNDITLLYTYIESLKQMLQNDDDNTEYSVFFQAMLVTGSSSKVNNNDVTKLYLHINGAKTGLDDINEEYNPDKKNSGGQPDETE